VAFYGARIGNSGGANSNWAVGTGVIVHSSGNQPSTWAQQGSAVTSGVTLRGCVATDAMHAWAFGANGAVLATSDGGTTWAGVTTPPSTTETLPFGAHSSGAALTLVGTNGVIFRSTNGGSSFTAERTGPQDALTAIHGPTAGTVFAVGNAGSIYTTTNGGSQWTKLAAPADTGTTAPLLAVWAASPTDVYAVGGTGTIVHSSNGTTFTKYTGAGAPTATTHLQDVWGSATLGVFAIGGDGSGATATRVVLRSTDHGATWTPLTIAGFNDAASHGTGYSVFALGSDVWVAGDAGLVYHSTDGTNFTAQTTGTNALITQLRGVSGHLVALLATDPGTYLSSSNNGATWVAPTQPSFNDNATDIAFVPDESSLYVFGAFNPPALSIDKGGTWTPLVTAMAGNVMRAAWAFAANDVYVIGDTGIIHYGN
jgi:photosystem II stability/assembly factor-like uncharacterized protein